MSPSKRRYLAKAEMALKALQNVNYDAAVCQRDGRYLVPKDSPYRVTHIQDIRLHPERAYRYKRGRFRAKPMPEHLAATEADRNFNPGRAWRRKK
jgi:hypothetical protein